MADTEKENKQNNEKVRKIRHMPNILGHNPHSWWSPHVSALNVKNWNISVEIGEKWGEVFSGWKLIWCILTSDRKMITYFQANWCSPKDVIMAISTPVSTPMLVRLPISQLRFDYDTTAIRRHNYDEKLTFSFFARVDSRRMEAGARDTS